jgi:hypothetical protein
LKKPDFQIGDLLEVKISNNPYCPVGETVVVEKIEQKEDGSWFIVGRKYGSENRYIFDEQNGVSNENFAEKVMLT